MAMSRQKTRWMLLGWLGRAAHLTSMAAPICWEELYQDGINRRHMFTEFQRHKLRKAAQLIFEVLSELREPSK